LTADVEGGWALEEKKAASKGRFEDVSGELGRRPEAYLTETLVPGRPMIAERVSV